MPFSSIPEILEDLKAGKMIVLVDDEDRENEGDLVCAGEKTTPEIINFMMTHGRGMICLAMAPDSRAEDLVQPGVVSPLRARPGGVLVRAGQTEGSVDLARLAGLRPAGVICEIMNADGTMSRRPDLVKFARKH